MLTVIDGGEGESATCNGTAPGVGRVCVRDMGWEADEVDII